jgi:hypothetical protein
MQDRRLLKGFLSLLLAASVCATAGCGSSSTSLVQPSAAKCTVSATNNTSEVPASGGNGTVTVTAARDCSWTASAEASWVTLGTTSGQGPGTLNYSVQPNPNGAPRNGRITVAQQAIDVAQAAAPCRIGVSPAAVNLDATGGSFTLAITIPVGCRWTVRSDAPWIGTPVPSSGTGSGSIAVNVAANASQARTASVTIGDTTVRVNQAAASGPSTGPTPTPEPTPSPTPTPPGCSYKLGQTSLSAGQTAEAFTIRITAPAGCAWTVSTDSPWITITDGRTGSGTGSFRISVAANSGAARAGTVRAATETLTVRQDGGTCSYSIKPGSYNASQGPGDILVSVTADAGCAWTASTSADWVTVAEGRSGSGNGTVRLLIPSNDGGPRTAIVAIAGETFTLNQDGDCRTRLKPKDYHLGHGPDDIRVAVSAKAGCSWTASSNVSWVTVAEGATGSGDGTVRLLVQRNSGPDRSTTLSIAGQPFDLRQDGTR